MLPSSMKTVEFKEPGGPEVLLTGERPLPSIGDEQVLVKVTAAGVNGPDMMQRKGQYPPPPGASDLMGLEVSGEVVAAGKNVSQWKEGDLICALTNGGGYAEYVAVDANHCVTIPNGVDVIDAAGLCETFFTVWSNFFFQRDVVKDGIFLVHGGAGGIGITAIQLGKALGMRVFATCSNQENMKFCEENGAERAINYKEEDFVSVVKDAGGAALVLDIVGGDYIERNIKACAKDGHIVQLAFRNGAKVEVNFMPIMMKRLTLRGSTLRSRPAEFKAAVAADLQEKVWPMFASDRLRIHTHKVFTFDEAQEAHTMMENSGHRGKILLTPN